MKPKDGNTLVSPVQLTMLQKSNILFQDQASAATQDPVHNLTLASSGCVRKVYTWSRNSRALLPCFLLLLSLVTFLGVALLSDITSVLWLLLFGFVASLVAFAAPLLQLSEVEDIGCFIGCFKCFRSLQKNQNSVLICMILEATADIVLAVYIVVDENTPSLIFELAMGAIGCASSTLLILSIGAVLNAREVNSGIEGYEKRPQFIPLAIVLNDTACVFLITRGVLTGEIEVKDIILYLFLVLNVIISEVSSFCAILATEIRSAKEEITQDWEAEAVNFLAAEKRVVLAALDQDERKEDAETKHQDIRNGVDETAKTNHEFERKHDKERQEHEWKVKARQKRAITMRQLMRQNATSQAVITGLLTFPITLTSIQLERIGVEAILLVVPPIATFFWIAFIQMSGSKILFMHGFLGVQLRELLPRFLLVIFFLVLAFLDETLSLAQEVQAIAYGTYALHLLCPLLFRFYEDSSRASALKSEVNSAEKLTFKGRITEFEFSSTIPRALANHKSQVRDIDLSGNYFSNYAWLRFSAGLRKNRSLTKLNLRSNQLGPEVAKSFADTLKVNTTLYEIDLHKNHFGYEGRKALRQHLDIVKM